MGGLTCGDDDILISVHVLVGVTARDNVLDKAAGLIVHHAIHGSAELRIALSVSLGGRIGSDGRLCLVDDQLAVGHLVLNNVEVLVGAGEGIAGQVHLVGARIGALGLSGAGFLQLNAVLLEVILGFALDAGRLEALDGLLQTVVSRGFGIALDAYRNIGGVDGQGAILDYVERDVEVVVFVDEGACGQVHLVGARIGPLGLDPFSQSDVLFGIVEISGIAINAGHLEAGKRLLLAVVGRGFGRALNIHLDIGFLDGIGLGYCGIARFIAEVALEIDGNRNLAAGVGIVLGGAIGKRIVNIQGKLPTVCTLHRGSEGMLFAVVSNVLNTINGNRFLEDKRSKRFPCSRRW